MSMSLASAHSLGEVSLYFIITYFVVRKSFSTGEIAFSFLAVWLAQTVISMARGAFNFPAGPDLVHIVNVAQPIILIAITFFIVKATRNEKHGQGKAHKPC